MKAYLRIPGSICDVVEIDLPDDPIAAADAAVKILDEQIGNAAGYPAVLSQAEYDERLAEAEE